MRREGATMEREVRGDYFNIYLNDKDLEAVHWIQLVQYRV
jgi:hypothetical protein